MKEVIRSIQILAFSLIAGCLFFGGITLYLIYSNGPLGGNDAFNTQIMLIIGNAVMISSVAGGIFIFNNKLSDIESKPNEEKINIYRQAMIIRATMMEGPAFLFTVLFLLSGYRVYLGEALAMILLMVFFFPTPTRIANELKTDPESLN
jgi:hypothetical protein